MIRYIRVLGAALGGADRTGARRLGRAALFTGRDYAGAFLAAWVVAWVVVGFAILPYLTVVPALWLIRRVEELSTAEFVAAVIGLLLGLLMGLLLGYPAVELDPPWGTCCRSGSRIFLGLGMLGLTVAKRKDLLIAAEAVGIFRPPAAERGGGPSRGEPADRRRHERDHRRPDRRDRRVRASSTARSSSRASSSMSCSTSPTARTRCAGTAAGVASRS